MATIKTIVDTRRIKSDLTYPIVIRVTHERKSKLIPLQASIELNYWDSNRQLVKDICSDSLQINQNILSALNKLYSILSFLNESGKPFSINDIINHYSGNAIIKDSITFNLFAKQEIEKMIATGRVGNAYSYRDGLNSLSFHFRDNIKFTELNPKMLSEFEYKLKLKGLKVNSIAAYMRAIRAIYNKAIKLEVTSKINYPFDRYTIKHEATKKRAISVNELRKVFEIELIKNSPAWHSRNYFVLIFCLIGINFTDLCTLTLENLVNGRIQYRRKKTKKLYNIKLVPLAKEIIEIYRNSHSRFLLPILPERHLNPELQRKVIADKLKLCNKQLKKIGLSTGLNSPLTTYVSRHSWATTAKGLGISHEVIAECLGHSYGNRITGIYLDDFDKKHLDEANEQVINCVIL